MEEGGGVEDEVGNGDGSGGDNGDGYGGDVDLGGGMLKLKEMGGGGEVESCGGGVGVEKMVVMVDLRN